MDEEIARKTEFLHMGLGLFAGILSGLTPSNSGILGLAVGYSGYYVSKALFNLSKEEYPINSWFSKGALPFLMFWIPTWIFIYNV